MLISWLELRESTGERLWEQSSPTRLHPPGRRSDQHGRVYYPAGYPTGDVMAFNLDGNQIWEVSIGEQIGAVRTSHV